MSSTRRARDSAPCRSTTSSTMAPGPPIGASSAAPSRAGATACASIPTAISGARGAAAQPRTGPGPSGGGNQIRGRQRQQADKNEPSKHHGLHFRTEEGGDAAYCTVCEQAQAWKLKKISKPHLQHGTYSFFFWDGDDNCWEILTNPEGGYSWLFEQGDQEGKGHLDRNFKRPGVNP